MDTSTSGASGQAGSSNPPLIIPDEVKEKFTELVELILKSESMNDEERQYWINILTIMTPEQLQNLKDILMNERQQLAAIDAKYSKEINQIGQQQFLEQVAAERQKRREQRSNAEESAKQAEEQSAESLLKEIEGV